MRHNDDGVLKPTLWGLLTTHNSQLMDHHGCVCLFAAASAAAAARYADGPKYYSEPKLLSFDLQPYTSPQVTAGLANAPDFSQGEQLALHIASLSHQLQQFYAGAAVAAALGRVLVLPTFQCYCFRDPGSGPGGPGELSWGSSSSGSDSSSSSSSGSGWACRAPGDDNSVFPFNCTLDQVCLCLRRGREGARNIQQ